jgi:hypothetical protein
MLKVADEFVILSNTSGMGQNWIERVHSKTHKATYLTIQVEKTTDVVLYTYMLSGPCRNTLIVATVLQ